MLLASYQPLVEDTELRRKSRAFDCLVQELGFVPYFCFPAERLEDMLVHSFFVTPSWPEKIVICEAQEYRRLDIVQWNRILKLDSGGEPFDISLALQDAEEPFCEYLVPAFDDVRLEIGLREAVYEELLIDYADGDTKAVAEGRLSMAQGKAIGLIEKAYWGMLSGAELEIRKMRMLKNAFEICVLPLLYIYMISGRWEDFGAGLNADWIYRNVEPQRMLSRIYNPDEAWEYKTYAYFEKAFHTYRLNMLSSGSQPSRNGKCPCGSGKKYKRCCGA